MSALTDDREILRGHLKTIAGIVLGPWTFKPWPDMISVIRDNTRRLAELETFAAQVGTLAQEAPWASLREILESLKSKLREKDERITNLRGELELSQNSLVECVRVARDDAKLAEDRCGRILELEQFVAQVRATVAPKEPELSLESVSERVAARTALKDGELADAEKRALQRGRERVYKPGQECRRPQTIVDPLILTVRRALAEPTPDEDEGEDWEGDL